MWGRPKTQQLAREQGAGDGRAAEGQARGWLLPGMPPTHPRSGSARGDTFEAFPEKPTAHGKGNALGPAVGRAGSLRAGGFGAALWGARSMELLPALRRAHRRHTGGGNQTLQGLLGCHSPDHRQHGYFGGLPLLK